MVEVGLDKIAERLAQLLALFEAERYPPSVTAGPSRKKNTLQLGLDASRDAFDLLLGSGLPLTRLLVVFGLALRLDCLPLSEHAHAMVQKFLYVINIQTFTWMTGFSAHLDCAHDANVVAHSLLELLTLALHSLRCHRRHLTDNIIPSRNGLLTA